MLFVNYKINAKKEQVLAVIRDSESVVAEENYDTSRGKPKMHIKERNKSVKIKCEMTGRPTKDNAFLEGTYFLGGIKEREGVCRVRGLILTAPIYHLAFIAIFAYFIYLCFSIGGFSPVPVILAGFDLIMFKDEFRKQRLIKRYIFRALKITYRELGEKKKAKQA